MIIINFTIACLLVASLLFFGSFYYYGKGKKIFTIMATIILIISGLFFIASIIDQAGTPQVTYYNTHIIGKRFEVNGRFSHTYYYITTGKHIEMKVSGQFYSIHNKGDIIKIKRKERKGLISKEIYVDEAIC